MRYSGCLRSDIVLANKLDDLYRAKKYREKEEILEFCKKQGEKLTNKIKSSCNI